MYKKFFIIILISIFFLSIGFLIFPDNNTDEISYYNNSKKLFKEKKYKDALIEIKKAIEINKDNGEYNYLYANIFYMMHHDNKDKQDKKIKMKHAIAMYNAAIAKGYKNGLIYHRRGTCYFQNREFEEAEKDFIKASTLLKKELKIDNNNKTRDNIADIAVWLTKIYEITGEFDKLYKVVIDGLKYNKHNRWLPGKLKMSWRIKGHKAFIKGDYNKAVKYYQDAEDKYWLSICKKHKQLGKITPEYTHVIMVLYITEIDFLNKKKQLEKIQGVSKTQKEKMEIWQGIMKHWIETFSNGKWSLDFMHLDVKSYTEEYGRYSAHSTHSVNQNEKMYLLSDEYDTYAVTSPTVSPGLGGPGSYPFIPEVFHGPRRGWFQVNSEYHNFNMWIHEFFHVVELMAGISPHHGYRKKERKSFPQWKGESELDYYEWHFKTTLKSLGWKNMNFRLKNKTKKIPIEKFRRITEENKDIPFNERKKMKF